MASYGRVKPAQATGATKVLPVRMSPLGLKATTGRKPRITDPLGKGTRSGLGGSVTV